MSLARAAIVAGIASAVRPRAERSPAHGSGARGDLRTVLGSRPLRGGVSRATRSLRRAYWPQAESCLSANGRAKAVTAKGDIQVERKEDGMSPDETRTAAPAQDERITAAMAHVTAILPLFGIMAPIVVWTTQKDRSRFVAFQALQALVYQLAMILAWLVGMACYMCSYIGIIAGPIVGLMVGHPAEGMLGPTEGLMVASMLVPFIVFGLISVGGIAFVLYGLVGAVQVLRGKEFRYVIIGTRLERYLQREARAEGEGVVDASDGEQPEEAK